MTTIQSLPRSLPTSVAPRAVAASAAAGPTDVVTLSAAATSRDLPLQGTWNTRQLGGLPARGGTIKADMIYRSDALQSLTPSDVGELKSIPIKTVIDLRRPSEITKDGPDVYQAPNRVSLPMGASDPSGSPHGYNCLLTENDKSLRGFFSTLAVPSNYPVLFHCHSGKDRTGIAAALLERVLGTPRDQILADYMASQHDKPTKQVDPSWIQAVFKTVDNAGGVDKFLEARGVTAAQLQSIRSILTVPRN